MTWLQLPLLGNAKWYRLMATGYCSLLNILQSQIKYIRRIEAAGHHWSCKDRIPIFLTALNFVGLSPGSIPSSYFKSRSALLPWEGYCCMVCMWCFHRFLVAMKLMNQLWRGWLYVWGGQNLSNSFPYHEVVRDPPCLSPSPSSPSGPSLSLRHVMLFGSGHLFGIVRTFVNPLLEIA